MSDLDKTSKIPHARNIVEHRFGRTTRMHTTTFRQSLTREWSKRAYGDKVHFPRYHVATADWDGRQFMLRTHEFVPTVQVPESYRELPEMLKSSVVFNQETQNLDCTNFKSERHVRLRLQQWSREQDRRRLEICTGEFRLHSQNVDHGHISHDDDLGPGAGVMERIEGFFRPAGGNLA